MKKKFKQAINLLSYMSIICFFVFDNPINIDYYLMNIFRVDSSNIFLFKIFLLVALAFLFFFFKKVSYSLYYGNLYTLKYFFDKFIYIFNIKFSTFLLFITNIVATIMIIINYQSICKNINIYPYYNLYIIILFIILSLIYVFVIYSFIRTRIKLVKLSKDFFTPFLTIITNNLLDFSTLSFLEKDKLFTLLNKYNKEIAFDENLYNNTNIYIYLYSSKYIHNNDLIDVSFLNEELTNIAYKINYRNYYITKISYLPFREDNF